MAAIYISHKENTVSPAALPPLSFLPKRCGERYRVSDQIPDPPVGGSWESANAEYPASASEHPPRQIGNPNPHGPATAPIIDQKETPLFSPETRVRGRTATFDISKDTNSRHSDVFKV